jgi:hypothetical protein
MKGFLDTGYDVVKMKIGGADLDEGLIACLVGGDRTPSAVATRLPAQLVARHSTAPVPSRIG